MQPGEAVTKMKALNEGLKRVNPGLGYTEEHDGAGRLVAYRVHYLNIFPDKDIPVGQGWGKAEETLLKELTMMAQHYKPSLLLPVFPNWLVPEAQEFCNHPKPGLYYFGSVITFPSNLSGIPCTTREQLVWASTTSLEVFRYWSTDRFAYSKDVYYNACMHWNLEMWHYIERRELPPSVAIQELKHLQRELIDKICEHLLIDQGLRIVETMADQVVEHFAIP